MATLWKDAAAKVRNAQLRSINSRMKKRVGDSDLGRLMPGGSLLMAGRSRLMSRDWELPPKCSVRDAQTLAYAAALGISFEDAQARVMAQEAALNAAGQPGAGASPAMVRRWLESLRA